MNEPDSDEAKDSEIWNPVDMYCDGICMECDGGCRTEETGKSALRLELQTIYETQARK